MPAGPYDSISLQYRRKLSSTQNPDSHLRVLQHLLADGRKSGHTSGLRLCVLDEMTLWLVDTFLESLFRICALSTEESVHVLQGETLCEWQRSANIAIQTTGVDVLVSGSKK